MEIWKDVRGYEGLYKISNVGNVMSIKQHRYKKQNYVLKYDVDWKGYARVKLWRNNKGKNYKVHRLVAQAFIPNLENKLTVNHKDLNKLNNKLTNLEWATYKEQATHYHKTKPKNYIQLRLNI